MNIKVNTENTYWSKSGRHQAAFDWLESQAARYAPSPTKLDPQWEQEADAYRRFQRAKHCYYDLFASNLCGSYSRDFSRLFKVCLGDYTTRARGRTYRHAGLYVVAESRFDAIVLEAAEALGFRPVS